MDEFLKLKPDALLIPRILLTPDDWWCATFPEDITMRDDGSPAGMFGNRCHPTLASSHYRELSHKAMQAFLDHVEGKYGGNILGYQVGNGFGGEWLMFNSFWETRPVQSPPLIDVYTVSHHGWYQSSSLPFLNAIAPRVAIMDNGAKKGGTPSAWDIIEKSPRLLDLWQLHCSDEGEPTHNVSPEFTANPDGPDEGRDLELTAWSSGEFEVLNSRTHKSKYYSAH
jgi:hypothetical protein